VIAVSIPNTFQSTPYRTLRACVFSALGLWGVVPVAHQLIFYWDVWAIRTAFQLDMLMGVLYLVSRRTPPSCSAAAGLAVSCFLCLVARPCRLATSLLAALLTLNPTPPPPPSSTPTPQAGAAIYASRIPERWMPGKLDLIGHSHQLWHITVVLAALVHYKAIMVLLQWRDASGGCAAQLHTHMPTMLQAIQSGDSRVLEIDQVWHNLSMQLHQYVGVPTGVQPQALAV